MEGTRNSFRLLPESRIVILSSAKEDRFTAQLLAEEFRQVTGRNNQITADRIPAASSEILLGRFTDALLQSFLRSENLKTDGVTEEGYVLEVTPHRNLVAGKDSAGLFYGVQTLRQLIVPSDRGGDILGARIGVCPTLSLPRTQINLSRRQLSNSGCDEAHEVGNGRSAARVQQEGYGRVYLDSVRRAYEIARRYHKRVIFWGDMAVAHPDLIAGLPKDIVAATWEYFPHPSYSKWIKPFADAGIKIIICPWVGDTNLIIPNYDVAAYNIANFIDEGKQAESIGVNVTVWNDDGESLFAPNWWSIVYGAANAWEPTKTDVAHFDKKFDWAFYRNTDYRFTETLKKLSLVN